MFDRLFLNRIKKFGIFVVAFTLIYILFFMTLKYTLPFVLGFFIALSTMRFNQFLIKKGKMSPGLSSLITTTIVFLILGTIITLIVYKAATETVLLLSKIPSLDKITYYIDILIKEITDIIGQIDPVIMSKLYEYLQILLSRLLNISIIFLNSILSVVMSLPRFLLIAVITFIATYLFSKDLKKFSSKFYTIFSNEGKSKMRSIIESGIAMTIGYAKAYSLVVFITFLQVLIGLTLLQIDFALIISILCAILDLLPIVGMIMIFIPLILFNFYVGNSMTGILLIILFVLVQIVRQVIEPKIVSHTLDIHPLLILASIFIGLKISGVLGMLYFIGLLVGYKVLVKVKVI